MRRATTVVVVPSRTIEKFHEPPAETQAYEERLLCLLLELRERSVRMVYVTSMPVAQDIVDYYLGLLPADIRDDARDRLTMLSAEDPSLRPLSAKLLERPTLLTRIRWEITDHEDAHLIPYVTTELEFALGKELGIPVMGADPALAHLGTKSGGRELFARAGVAHPLGIEHVRSRADVIAAIARLRAVRPRIGQAVVKLDDGVSGEGNAIVELRGLGRTGTRAELLKIAERVDAMRLQAANVSLYDYFDRLERGGGSSRSGSSRGSCAARASSSSSSLRRARRLHARPDPRGRPLRRLPFSGRARVRGRHRGGRRADRRAARGGGRDRARGDRLHRRPRPVGDVERVRDRDQPAQGRDDASAVHPGARDGRDVRSAVGHLPRPGRLNPALRRDGLPRFATAVGAGRRRVVRACGSPRSGT